MKNGLKLFFSIVLLCSFEFNYAQNIAEKLGYPKNSKLLIIHADDLGVSHSENRASIKGLETTPVNSASIMVPCPWFLEIANYAKTNTGMDLGLHLTLNSEWSYYKWAPVTARDSVRSLVDENGYFFDNIPQVVKNGNPEHVKLELKNQVKMALRNKIDVTHLDAHMGTAGASLEFLKKYITIGNQFQLPVLLVNDDNLMKEPEVIKLISEGKQIVLDRLYTAGPTDYENGMTDFYTRTLNELESGLSTILIHLAYDDEEMQAMTTGKQYWGSKWRQEDVDFFSSNACKGLIEANNIVLVTWREIRDKINRSKN